jgi:hypothetical protein
MMLYTTDDIIIAAKRNASIPTSQKKFTTSDFLAFMNEELQLTIVGEMLSLREDYFVTSSTTALVANQDTYAYPTAAVGWKLEAIWHVDSNRTYSKLQRIHRNQRHMYQTLDDASSPVAYFFSGSKIEVVPSVGSTASGSIQFDYVRIQNELVSVSSTGLVSSVVDTGTDYQITVGTVPSTTDGVDVISGTNPFGAIVRSESASVVGSVVTISKTNFDRAPVAGDYVCSTGKTCIPNIPEDYHPILAQALAIRCLANDPKMLQTQGAVLQNMLNRLRDRSSRRVNNSPRKIVSNSAILNMMR